MPALHAVRRVNGAATHSMMRAARQHNRQPQWRTLWRLPTKCGIVLPAQTKLHSTGINSDLLLVRRKPCAYGLEYTSQASTYSQAHAMPAAASWMSMTRPRSKAWVVEDTTWKNRKAPTRNACAVQAPARCGCASGSHAVCSTPAMTYTTVLIQVSAATAWLAGWVHSCTL